jgi:hypothetical protein
MPMTLLTSGRQAERRREPRLVLPALEIVIGDEGFRVLNWSMTGALLYGICDVVGARVKGEIEVPGSRQGLPFAATVIRADLDTGNCAICFEDCRTETMDFREDDRAAVLQ